MYICLKIASINTRNYCFGAKRNKCALDFISTSSKARNHCRDSVEVGKTKHYCCECRSLIPLYIAYCIAECTFSVCSIQGMCLPNVFRLDRSRRGSHLRKNRCFADLAERCAMRCAAISGCADNIKGTWCEKLHTISALPGCPVISAPNNYSV